MIQPTASFKDNLALLDTIEGLTRITLTDANGNTVATIENLPGKQGSLRVYQYLHQNFGLIDERAAAHGLAVFAEHTTDAKNRPGAHPNIDILMDIVNGGASIQAQLVTV